jgi:thiol-disulfide isomerase/thioredoxin
MSKKSVRAIVIAGILGLLAMGFLMSNSGFSQGVKAGEWTQDYDTALKFAQKEKLPILLNFTGSDWCSWCQLMQRNVFTQTNWKQYARNKMMLVTLDFPKNKNLVSAEYAARNNRLQQQFGVRGYPTYIVLDSDGKTVLGKLGAGRDKTAQSFIEEMDDVLLFSEGVIEKTINSLSAEKAKEYRATMDRLKDTYSDLDAWLSTQPARNQENIEKYNAFLAEIEKTKEQLQQIK